MKINIVAKPRTPYNSSYRKETHYEQVDLIDMASKEVYPEGFCMGTVHIDSFHSKNDMSIYDRLLVGQSVNLSLVENKETNDD